MATAVVTNTPECSICFETFKKPKVLLCGHTFCFDCIVSHIGENRKTFPCPICQQYIRIPPGGAKEFTTNFVVQNNPPPLTTQPKCPNHNQRGVDYYCNNCKVGLCFKCIFGQHKDHEALDIECDETRNNAIEKLQRSQNIIQNRMKKLKKTRSTLLESFEQLKSLCEHSCTKVTEKTEQIVSDLRKSCKQIIKEIGDNLEENRIKVEDREKEITSDINVLERYMESNFSPSTKTTLDILTTLPRLAESLGESRKDDDLCLQYLQWVGKDFSLNTDQLGSVISKSFEILPSFYQFEFNVSDIKKDDKDCYSKGKFRNNNLVWSCRVVRSYRDDVDIGIRLLQSENPGLNYCITNSQFSLLNIDDESKSITKTYSNKRLEKGGWLLWRIPITWSNLTDKNNGYLTTNDQFVVKYDITQANKISWK